MGYLFFFVLVQALKLAQLLDRIVFDVPRHPADNFRRLKTAISTGGFYLIPPSEAHLWVGSWYDPTGRDSIERYYVHKFRNAYGVLKRAP